MTQKSDRFEAMPHGVWAVRSGRNLDTVGLNLERSVVTVGYADWLGGLDPAEFAAFTAGDFDRYFAANQREHSQSTRRTSRNVILRFRDDIGIGDLVVLPLERQPSADAWIAIGRITGGTVLDSSWPKGARLRRPVDWLTRSVPESAVLSRLHKSIKQSQWTVFKPNVSTAFERIFHVAQHGTDPGARDDPPSTPSGDEASVLTDADRRVPEGAKTRIEVNRYEGDPGRVRNSVSAGQRLALQARETRSARNRNASGDCAERDHAFLEARFVALKSRS